jgi:hypothetical protein
MSDVLYSDLNHPQFNPCGRAVKEVCLRRLCSWDREFDSRWLHECLSLVFVACSEELITLSDESYHVCV